MNLQEIVHQVIVNTVGPGGTGWFGIAPDSSLGVFLPELVLCATIVLMLLVRLFRWGQRADMSYLALGGSAIALVLASYMAPAVDQRMEIFTGMLVYDAFSVYMRSLLLLFAVLFIIFTKLSGVPRREDGADIYTLVLGALLGMCLMVSANHLLMVFMAVEMASVPSYALAGLRRGDRKASEAALKYAVYGAGAAGVMLYGISLIAGLANSAHLPTIAHELAQRLPMMQPDEQMALAMGGLMILVGLAFKLSAVPFHFWCPDVFEGATAEIDAFLSVASKAAALGLLVRVAIGVGVEVPEGAAPGHGQAPAVVSAPAGTSESASYFAVKDRLNTPPHLVAWNRPGHAVHAGATGRPSGRDGAPLAPIQGFIARLVALVAIVTCTFGNLAAYGQTNIKRLLAYSTIAHAGYMMMAVPPAMALVGGHAELAEQAIAALGIYIAVYLFLNLGAFCAVAFLRNAMGSEQIAQYAGLMRRCPAVVICLSAILFGLLGVPPLSGFVGKFAIFASVAQGYEATSEFYLLALLVLGCLNTALSLFYYLRVVKVMIMDPEPDDRGEVALPLVSLRGLYLFAITVPTLVLIVCWSFLSQLASAAARQLLG